MTKQYIKFLIKADSVNESVLPRNQVATLKRRKILRQPCSCRPGMRAHAARDGIRAFVLLSYFFENLQNPFPRPWAPGHGGEKSEACIQGFMASCLSKLHSGRNIRDIHDRWE